MFTRDVQNYDSVMHLIDTFQVIPDNVETEHFVAHILFDWLSPGTWIVSEATIQKVRNCNEHNPDTTG